MTDEIPSNKRQCSDCERCISMASHYCKWCGTEVRNDG